MKEKLGGAPISSVPQVLRLAPLAKQRPAFQRVTRNLGESDRCDGSYSTRRRRRSLESFGYEWYGVDKVKVTVFYDALVQISDLLTTGSLPRWAL